MNNIYPFSEWLQDALKETHMPQLELAMRLDMDQGRISRYVNGKAVPKLENIIKILDIFGKKIEVIEKNERRWSVIKETYCMGKKICPHCGEAELLWDDEQDAEESGYIDHGIISFYHCEKCGAIVECYVSNEG